MSFGVVYSILSISFVAISKQENLLIRELNLEETREIALTDLIQTSLGQLQGRLITTVTRVQGYAFLGIPYAEPPIGELRFKAPVPESSWNGTLDATSYQKDCMWNSSFNKIDLSYSQLSEDCLYLNVFTSRRCLERRDCAVMFYVHGGGFKFEGPGLLKPEIIIDNFLDTDRNVVVVTFAYRLGILGMINLAPGLNSWSTLKNLASHDQLTALKFAHREIHAFGGDPNRITLMGHSSGGHDSYMLSLSPRTKFIIHQVVVMAPLNPEQAFTLGQNTKTSRKIAEAFNCANNTTDYTDLRSVKAVLSCLRNVSVESLIDTQRTLEDQGHQLVFRALDMFGPDPVFPYPKEHLISKKKPIPMLTGTVSKELSLSYDLLKNGIVDQNALETTCLMAIKTMGLTSVNESLANCIRTRQLFDDVNFFVPILDIVRKNSETGMTTYLYELKYSDFGDAYMPEPGFKLNHDWEPHHGLYGGELTPKDHRIKSDWSRFFVNFINTGNPGFGMEKFDPDKDNYLSMDFDGNGNMETEMRNGYREDTVQFWEGLKRNEEPFWRGWYEFWIVR
ncbi:hypothetical protein L596_016757 [Steinernema carpocapsae]|uniref:Carboxylic ester hydrolase n=1 Tax=Steinernema carpocapsae TaxID=34508 RepID=A0A4U5NK91_STECR|nr:hypothetical protein L596_016757 [Steinernema carpocapsae]